MISVLYVDDEPFLLDIGKHFLERDGKLNVDTIPSAQAALSLLNSKNYDAIISDYQMPGMNGIELLKTVRTLGNTIPFIIFTGRGREEIVIQALNEGADFYLQKGGEPVSQFAELSHKVLQAVHQRRAEASIRDHERREADIINFLPDATFAIDKDGVVIAWNQAMEKMTGIKPLEILGKGNYEYALPFYHERRPMLIDLVITPDKIVENIKYLYTVHDNCTLTAESTFEKPDGTSVNIWQKASRLFDQNGNLTGAIESIRDITDNKVVEKELQIKNDELMASYEQLTAVEEELREQFDALAENERLTRINEERLLMAQEIGRTGCWDYNVITGKIWGSAEARRIFCYPAVAVNFPLEDIESCIPERERVHQALVDLITDEKEYNIDYAINPADGSPQKKIHSVARLEKDNEGKTIRVMGVIQDITERN